MRGTCRIADSLATCNPALRESTLNLRGVKAHVSSDHPLWDSIGTSLGRNPAFFHLKILGHLLRGQESWRSRRLCSLEPGSSQWSPPAPRPRARLEPRPPGSVALPACRAANRRHSRDPRAISSRLGTDAMRCSVAGCIALHPSAQHVEATAAVMLTFPTFAGIMLSVTLMRRIHLRLPYQRGFVPKAKPVSLHPLTFHEALKAIVGVDPDSVGITSKRRKRRKRKRKTSESNQHP